MMTGLRNAKLWTAVLVVTAIVAAPGAQQPSGGSVAITLTPPAPTPQGPSAPQAQAIESYVVGQAKPPEVPGAPMVDLTLEKAILIALENNLDLQSQRINPILQDISLRALRANYLPTFSSSFSHSNQKRPNTNLLLDSGLTTITTLSQSYSIGMNQNLPWYGGSLRFSFGSGRNATNQPSQPNNPSLSGNFSANYSMPLLAGFKIDNNRNSLRTAPIQRQITDITLQNQIENTKAQVRTAYWSLRRTIEQIEIQRRALEIAKRQLNETTQKVEIGTVAPIETTNFEVSVASAEGSLLNAEISWRNQELAFKRLLVGGANDPLYTSTINPTDQPILVQTPVDIQAAVQNALANRTDLETQRKNLQVAEMGLEVTRNSTLPNLSMSAGYSMSGQGGPTTQGGVFIPGGYFDALSSMFDRPSWNIGLNYSYPLGQVSVKSQLAQAELRLEQNKVSLKAQELTVTADVTQAGLNVTNAWRTYEAAKKSADAQQKNAEAAQTRFTAGLATPFEVAQALQSLTNQRLSVLNAIINYLNAVADFEKRQKVGG